MGNRKGGALMYCIVVSLEVVELQRLMAVLISSLHLTDLSIEFCP